jgi:adenine-specific DNA-methyltransferase
VANEGAEAISENHQGQLHGKLELTWVNKDDRFLGDERDRWVWVKPTDFRVAEVRLLHDSDSVGDVDAPANLLICGDALSALSSLLRIPSYATTYAGKVRLAYLDPPFNSQQAFEHYDDALEHSAWLTMMRDRLEQIRDLLAPDGSVWVHLDDSEAAYCRVMMDGIFGRENFVATVVWEKRYSRENRRAIGFAHDSILVYAKNGPQEWAQRRNRLPGAQDPGLVARRVPRLDSLAPAAGARERRTFTGTGNRQPELDGARRLRPSRRCCRAT